MKNDWQSEVRRSTRQDFYALWDAWRPKVKRKPSEWAVKERRIAAGQSPLSSGEDIEYSHAVAPHAVEPMDAVDDPEVNIIVLWMARRMMKTEGICCNVIGRTMTDDPGNIFDNWPVEDSSARFVRDVIDPMIQVCPALRELVVEKKSRDSGNTLDYKKFPGGSLLIMNAGSRSKTRGMAAKVVINHEVDAYPVSSQGEGDPIAKAFGRAEGFPDAIKIIESTGTFAADIDPGTGKKIYRSNIEMWYDRSDQRKWFCPCRKCGVGQWLKFERIADIEKKSGSIFFYLCEFCETDHGAKQWERMVRDGKWKPTAAFKNGIRGYWINQFCSLLPAGKGFKDKLHQFHAEGIQAMNGKPEEKQVWINEVKAELSKIDEGEDEAAPEWKPIFDGREDYYDAKKGVIIPKEGLIVTAMVDVHGNRLEILWKVWSKSGETWALKHSVIDGSNRSQETWDELAVRLREQKFKHASGHTLPLSMTFIDAGWGWEWIAGLFLGVTMRKPENQSLKGKIRASAGKGAPNLRIIAKKWGTIGGSDKGKRSSLKGVHIGTWEAKDTIYERLREGDAAECRMHYPTAPEFDEAFFQQLTVETVVMKFKDRKLCRTYDNPKGLRNEALDLEVGNLAAFMLRKWDFESVERRIALTVEEATERVGEGTKKKSRMRHVRGVLDF